MSQTVGELLVSTLADIGATQVFGVVGDALNPFTDALRRDKRMSWLGVRHEEGAALAATGQAKLTGRLGVCAGTTGPGANHLLAGLYEARHDHAPVLAIAGDVPTTMDGIDYLQAADHVSTFRDACVYATSVTSPDAASAQIHEAISAAYAMRGVALLNIPQNVFGAKTSKPALSPATLRCPREIAPDQADINAAAALIDQAKSVVLFVGYGAHSAKAEVLALAQKIKAPIVHTYRALDLFSFDNPQVIGGLGLIGSKAGIRRRPRLRPSRNDRQRLSLQRVPAAKDQGHSNRRARLCNWPPAACDPACRRIEPPGSRKSNRWGGRQIR